MSARIRCAKQKRGYRVEKIDRVWYDIVHFLQMSLQLLVKVGGNDLYHNKSYESSPPCTRKDDEILLLKNMTKQMGSTLIGGQYKTK
jgi:hypothetical protein